MISKTKGRERESYSSQRSQQQMQISISKTSPVMNFLFLHYRPNTKKAMLGGLRAFTLLPTGALGAAAIRSWSCRGSTGSGGGGSSWNNPLCPLTEEETEPEEVCLKSPNYERRVTRGGWRGCPQCAPSPRAHTHTHIYAYVHTGRHMHYIFMYIHVWVHVCRHVCIQEDFDLL